VHDRLITPKFQGRLQTSIQNGNPDGGCSSRAIKPQLATTGQCTH
jgi:hypothetical protein